MKNFTKLCAMFAAVAFVAGCSKKSESGAAVDNAPATNQEAVAAGNVPVPAPQRGGAFAAVNSLPEVSKAMQSGQYESAVNTLTQMKTMTPQMTDAQRQQYQQAVRDATTALIAAQGKDPGAKAAYEKLSRSMTGR